MVCGVATASRAMNAGDNNPRRNNKRGECIEDEEDDDDFMMRIVHGSCQGVFPSEGNCQKVTCQMSEQLDLLTVCCSLACLPEIRMVYLPLNSE